MNWITGKKAQEEYGISGLDWIGLVRGGLQPHYSNGDTMPPADLDVRRNEMVRFAFKVKDNRREIQRVRELERAGEPNYGLSFESQISMAEQEIKSNISRLKTVKTYVKQSGSGSWEAFEIPTNHRSREAIEGAYKSIYKILGDALYKKKQVEQLVKGRLRKNTNSGDGIADTRKELSEPEAEQFVRSLRVKYVNDTEVTVQRPNESPAPYTYANFGCKRNDTKEWKALQSSIEGPDHLFRTHKRGVKPDAQRKILNEIDSKLKSFFHKEFSVRLSDDFKTFVLVPAEGVGVYQFKFKVGDQDNPPDFTAYTDDVILKAIDSSRKTLSEKGNDVFLSLCAEAKKRGLEI
jgi:hypothetical protein